MKHLLLLCFVFMLTIMPQETPFAKDIQPVIKLDTTTINTLLNYKRVKNKILVAENDKLMNENSIRTEKIQKKIDSIFNP